MARGHELPGAEEAANIIWSRMTSALLEAEQLPEVGSLELKVIMEAGAIAADLGQQQKESKKPTGN